MELPAASLVRHVGEVALEPFARQTSDLVQRARLFEEMCRPWNDHKLLFAAEPREGCPVEFNHLEIVPANDKQRGALTRGSSGQARSGRPPLETRQRRRGARPLL
jgi:hypothetical protein